MLVEAFHELGAPFRECFLKKRVFQAFIWFMLALLSVRGRRTLSAALPPGSPHSSFYRIFSKDRWSLDGVFLKLLGPCLDYLPPRPFIPVALDDTVTKKTGLLRGMVRWLRDASNVHLEYHSKEKKKKARLCRGLRWIHQAFLGFVPGQGPQALTVGFDLAQPLKKPGLGTSKEAWAEFRKKARASSAPALGAKSVHRLRSALDACGCNGRPLLVVVDAGYMNRTFLRELPDRTGVLGRVRKDTHLVFPASTPGTRRLYGDRAPSPEAFRKDDEGHPWIGAECYFGGEMRPVRYKELGPVCWPKVTKGRKLRLIVVAPIPYWAPGKKRKSYNQPAYLLTTDLTTSAVVLIQTYLERWLIEVLHRDLKSELGCTQPQVWSRASVQRVVPAMAAAYTLLRLAALKAFGPSRDPKVYGDLPAYRRKRPPRQPSVRDLLNRLRRELKETCPGLTAELT